MGPHVNEILDLRQDKDNSSAFFPLSPIAPPLLSPSLHCSLLPVSLSCPLSLANRSQFVKGQPCLFSTTYLLPKQKSQTMLPVASRINSTRIKNRPTLGHNAAAQGVCLTTLCAGGPWSPGGCVLLLRLGDFYLSVCMQLCVCRRACKTCLYCLYFKSTLL